MYNADVSDLPPTEPRWSKLSAPVDPGHDMIIMRAQSYLSGSLLVSERCPGGACPPLTLDQAIDVLAWAGITL